MSVGRSNHQRHDESKQDEWDAEQLYAVLEREIVPGFYDRDASGLPVAWLARIRRSSRFDTAIQPRAYGS